jgi:hypothetical protein
MNTTLANRAAQVSQKPANPRKLQGRKIALATPAGIEPATFSLEEGCWSNDFNGRLVGTAAIRSIDPKQLFPAVGTGMAPREIARMRAEAAR